MGRCASLLTLGRPPGPAVPSCPLGVCHSGTSSNKPSLSSQHHLSSPPAMRCLEFMLCPPAPCFGVPAVSTVPSPGLAHRTPRDPVCPRQGTISGCVQASSTCRLWSGDAHRGPVTHAQPPSCAAPTPPHCCSLLTCPWGWAAWGSKDQGHGRPAPAWPLGVHGHTLGSLSTDVPTCVWAYGGLLHTGVLSVCLSPLVSANVCPCVSASGCPPVCRISLRPV